VEIEKGDDLIEREIEFGSFLEERSALRGDLHEPFA